MWILVSSVATACIHPRIPAIFFDGDLYQQENQLFADHKDVWDKVFGMMSKSTADPSGNYADYLAGTVESNKDSFTEDELKTLNDMMCSDSAKNK